MVGDQPLTSFIGRERETATVRERLRRADVRLVTLSGPGGIGKTRLALRVAAALGAKFADGSVFVSLASLATPDLVASTIAHDLGIADLASDSIKAFLKEKQLLLVLDNFEHVSEAAPLVAELLGASPRLKVLATSRVPLRLGGEHTLLVPPMALPDRGAATAAVLGESDSVKLFVERAQAVNQDFVLTDENASSIAEICRRVDGLPLAIELAATRVRALSPRGLFERMPPSLPLLTDGPRDAPARQQTLRNTIAWSYDLLDPAEQTLFRRLAVFRGCTLDAAEAVCKTPATSAGSPSIAAGPLAVDVLDGVASLVEKSLLRYETLPDGEPWYLMLETIREFALERLTESGEADVIQRRHILHYLELAESREQTVIGQEGAWHARIEREHDNLRVALDGCVTRGYVEPGFRLALALWWFWMVCGHVNEGRARFAALFDRFPLREVSGPRAAQRARALGAAGTLASVQADFTVARALQAEGVAIWRKLGDLAGLAAGLEGLALSAATSGDYPTAREGARECLAIARDLDDKLMIAQALYLSANVLHEQGELEAARQSAEESIAILEEAGFDVRIDSSFIAPYRLILAVVLQELGDYDAAQQLTESTLSEYQEYGEWRALAVALANLGSIAIARGDFAAARQRLNESLVIGVEMRDLAGTAFVLERFVGLVAAQRQHERAVTLAGAAAAMREAVGVPLPPRGRTRLDEALAGPRRALGETLAAKAWTAGRGMPVVEAVAFARAPVRAIGGDAPVLRNAQSSRVLSAREREVAALIARGRTNRAIAAELVIAEGTAAIHVAHILNKLGFDSRSQIAAWVIENRMSSN